MLRKRARVKRNHGHTSDTSVLADKVETLQVR